MSGMKRLLDIVVAATGLVLLSPAWLVAAVLILREDPGPLIYKSTRVGKDGRDFKMWKFRTMVRNADRIGGPSTAADDPRLLRAGNTLRRYKLDELPQLVNVLRGDMS